jgi:hypothetical protein
MANEQIETALPEEPKALKLTGVSQCPMVYANVGTVLSTPFDIQFVFGELREVTPDGAVAKAEIRVVVTPELAEIVLRALSTRLQMFIKQTGPLRNMGVQIGGEVPFTEGSNG